MKHEFSRQIFEKKTSNAKFRENPYRERRGGPCVPGHVEANSRFSEFYERA
jgi:hypothetical protein